MARFYTLPSWTQQLARDGHVTQVKPIFNSIWEEKFIGSTVWLNFDSLLLGPPEWWLYFSFKCHTKGLLAGPSYSSLLILDNSCSLFHQTSWLGIWHHQTTHCHSELSALFDTSSLHLLSHKRYPMLFFSSFCVQYGFITQDCLLLLLFSTKQCLWGPRRPVTINMNDCLVPVHLCESIGIPKGPFLICISLFMNGCHHVSPGIMWLSLVLIYYLYRENQWFRKSKGISRP